MRHHQVGIHGEGEWSDSRKPLDGEEDWGGCSLTPRSDADKRPPSSASSLPSKETVPTKWTLARGAIAGDGMLTGGEVVGRGSAEIVAQQGEIAARDTAQRRFLPRAGAGLRGEG